MDSLVTFLSALLIFLIIFMALLLFHYSRMQTKASESLRTTVESLTAQNQRQMDLIWKTSTLLASKDPMTYQMIQAMESQKTPPPLDSNEEDIVSFYLQQYGDVTDEEALNAIERQQFASPG